MRAFAAAGHDEHGEVEERRPLGIDARSDDGVGQTDLDDEDPGVRADPLADVRQDLLGLVLAARVQHVLEDVDVRIHRNRLDEVVGDELAPVGHAGIRKALLGASDGPFEIDEDAPGLGVGEEDRSEKPSAATTEVGDDNPNDHKAPSAGFEPAAYCSGGSRSIP